VPADRDLVLTDTERRLALRRIVGFDRLAAEELAAIAQHTRLRRFAAGSTVARAGEERRVVHVLVSGELRITRGGRPWPKGGELKPVLDLFWLARDAMSLEIDAPNGAVTLELPVDELEDVLDEHFPIWLATARALAGWLLDLQADAPASTEQRFRQRLNYMPAFTERLVLLGEGLSLAGGHLETLAQLAESATELRLVSGRALWSAGDPARAIIVPIAGALAGQARDESGAIGMLEVLAERPRASDLRVVEPTLALAIDGDRFLDVLEDHHEPARDYLALLALAVVRRLE
jgi:CRP-like cAMP-binding protein